MTQLFGFFFNHKTHISAIWPGCQEQLREPQWYPVRTSQSAMLRSVPAAPPVLDNNLDQMCSRPHRSHTLLVTGLVPVCDAAQYSRRSMHMVHSTQDLNPSVEEVCMVIRP